MSAADESEEVDRHVLKRYEVGQKLGKGVRILDRPCRFRSSSVFVFFLR